MDIKTAIQILDYHQQWRIGKIEGMKYTPKELTTAFDVVIQYVKSNIQPPRSKGG